MVETEHRVGKPTEERTESDHLVDMCECRLRDEKDRQTGGNRDRTSPPRNHEAALVADWPCPGKGSQPTADPGHNASSEMRR
jgi:hypothetical protein